MKSISVALKSMDRNGKYKWNFTSNEIHLSAQLFFDKWLTKMNLINEDNSINWMHSDEESILQRAFHKN